MRFHAFDPMTQSDQPVDVEVIWPDTVLVMGPRGAGDPTSAPPPPG
ncbi:MAG: hypothetical protein R3F65_32435 [bacterium]